MNEYKGIKRNQCPRVWNFIDGWHDLARENYESFLDGDKALHKLIKRCKTRRSVIIVLYNTSPYLTALMIYIN